VNEEGNRLSEREQVLPIIDRDVCTACAECVERCGSGALAVVGGEAAIIHPDLCRYCGDCEEACIRDGIALPFEVVFLDHLHDGSGLSGE